MRKRAHIVAYVTATMRPAALSISLTYYYNQVCTYPENGTLLYNLFIIYEHIEIRRLLNYPKANKGISADRLASWLIDKSFMQVVRMNTVMDTLLISRDEDIDRASRSLKAMSHPLRLKILCTLGAREISVQDIVENVGTSQSNISQHLAILRDKGILASRKDANRVYYRVGDERTLRLIGMMREVFCNASI